MGDRWSRSWAIARQSLAVLRANPELAVFPVVSGLVMILVTLSFAVPAFMMHAFDVKNNIPPLYYVGMAVYYLVSYFVVIFFNAGMVSCTQAALQGRKMTFGEGLSNAARHIGPILGWTLISATVGMVCRLLSENLGSIGKLIVALLGGAWNILTFFVVPILVLEDKGPIEAIKDSTSVLKRTWGERLIGSGGMGLALFLLALAPIPVVIVAFVVNPVAGLVTLGAAALYYLALSVVGSSLSSIYNTALYVYATTGNPPSVYTQQDILAAFKSKEEGKVVGYFRNKIGQ